MYIHICNSGGIFAGLFFNLFNGPESLTGSERRRKEYDRVESLEMEDTQIE